MKMPDGGVTTRPFEVNYNVGEAAATSESHCNIAESLSANNSATISQELAKIVGDRTKSSGGQSDRSDHCKRGEEESHISVEMLANQIACEGGQLGEGKSKEDQLQSCEESMASGIQCSEGVLESAKRKREAEPQIDDPLFVIKRPSKQPSAKRARKANVIVKKVRQKSEAENASICADDEPREVESKARRYQMEIVREAQKRNTIAYLETGCGKTLIAVLLMRSMAQRLRVPDQKRIAIFLVPTVALVYQQANVIDCHTDLKFGKYAGHMKVDSWKPEKWLEEIDKHEVLVMTPQILVDILTHGILKMDIVELLIFDECHHTDGKHPYNRIMNKYRDTPVANRPHIFGMTASPVSGKGLTSGDRAEKQLSRLEQKLDAKVYAVKDRSELEAFVPTPQTIEREYEAPFFPMEHHISNLEEIAKKYFVYKDNMSEVVFKDYEELTKKLQKSIKKLCNALAYCLKNLGFLCAIKAAELLVKEDVKDHYTEINLHVQAALRAAKDFFLREALDYLQSVAPNGAFARGLLEILPEHVIEGLVTPKVKLLVEVLLSYRDVSHMRCIVFVNRVVASLVLASLINELQGLSFLRCTYLAGVHSSRDTVDRKSQQAAVEDFRAGVYDLLVATNVAEEGIDVQGCHSVIRFDPCTCVRSHIQSRGRARRPGSDYVVFMEKGNAREKHNFNTILESETKMAERALDRPEESPPELLTEPELELFRVETTGACLTTDLSVPFLYRFCARLPGDKYYLPKPEFSHRLESGEMHVCVLRLPPNSPIDGLTGPPRKSEVLAKQVACLEACKKLHEIGALTDHLIPVADGSVIGEGEARKTGSNRNTGAGTTKRKELHNTFSTSQLKGLWSTAVDGASLFAYKITFSSDHRNRNTYANFALLMEAQLDDHVSELEVELVLRLEQIVTAKFHRAGKLHLSRDRLRDAKQYQELFFNGMFGKLLTRASKTSGSLPTRKALAVENSEELWNSERIYLLLPLRGDLVTADNNLPVGYQIDWRCIDETATAARMFRSVYTNDDSESVLGEEAPNGHLTTHPSNHSGDLHMAFGSRWKASEVVHKVVLTIHTGMIYVITEVHDKTARAPFPRIQDGKDSGNSKFSTYEDYFTNQHKHPLKYPDQPLLNAKQTHRPRNLLARNSVKSSVLKKSKSDADEVAPCTVDIPPELCVILGVSSAAVRSAYLLPSVMHRLDAALVASDLRRTIELEQLNCPTIKNTTVVEALTTLRCLEEFSLESLELLGDSFLKYSQSRYLFLEFDLNHEGQLSAKRSRQICNANLHRLAMSRRLPMFIRDEVFDPSRWVPPGMHPPKELLCRCNLENLYDSGYEKEMDDRKEDTEAKSTASKVVKIGKSCGKGHRWLCSKTVSDVVEALIGAYFVDGDANGAFSFMKWAGFMVDVEQEKIERAKARSEESQEVNVGADLQMLESILNYSFTNKGLLVEALTHASYQEFQGGCCYQRLEFLGDAVLDLLVTKHVFFSYPGLTPGHLTDLRSAAVNNECFARVAAKHKLNKYLRHGSGFLLKQIQDFLDAYSSSVDKCTYGWDGVKGPKVLGDLVESIAGAILVDSGFNLDVVWHVMKPLLSPIVSPETLPLHPVRELQELCHLRGLPMVLQVIQDEDIPRVIIEVDVGDQPVLSVTSSDSQRRTCHKLAAQEMLILLEKLGIWHPCKLSLRGEACKRPTWVQVSQSDNVEGLCQKVEMEANSQLPLGSTGSSTKRKVENLLEGVSTEVDNPPDWPSSKKSKILRDSNVQTEICGRALNELTSCEPLEGEKISYLALSGETECKLIENTSIGQEGHRAVLDVGSLTKLNASLGDGARGCPESERRSCSTASLLTMEHKELEVKKKVIAVPA